MFFMQPYATQRSVAKEKKLHIRESVSYYIFVSVVYWFLWKQISERRLGRKIKHFCRVLC